MALDRGDYNPFSAPAADLGMEGGPHSHRAGGMTYGAFLLIYFVASFTFMAAFWGVFWSTWMSLVMGWGFLPTLVFRGLPGGIFVGLFVSIFITGYLGLFMRQKTVTIPFEDPQDFGDRLDREMKKRRFPPGLRSGKNLVFVPKALFRTRFFDVVVDIGEGKAAVTGPGSVVDNLSKRLRQRR